MATKDPKGILEDPAVSDVISMFGDDILPALTLTLFNELGNRGHHLRIRTAKDRVFVLSGTASDFFDKFLGLSPDGQEEFCVALVDKHLFEVGMSILLGLNVKVTIVTRLQDGEDGSVILLFSR